MKGLIVLLVLVSVSSCNIFKRPSGGGGGGGYSGNLTDWLDGNVPTRNSCMGMETDPTEDDIHVAPAYSRKWKREWTNSLYNDFEKNPYKALLADDVLNDKTWEKLGCPNYKGLYDKQRRAVWITFIAELARLESGYNTNTIGDSGRSNGLLQLSYKTTTGGYGCKFSGRGDSHLRSNPKENLRCGILVLNKNFRSKRLCNGKIPCGGGSGKPTIGYFGPFEGALHSGSKYKTFFRNVGQHIHKLYPFCSKDKSKGTDITSVVKAALPSQDYRKRIGQKSVKDNRCVHIADGDRNEPGKGIDSVHSETTDNSSVQEI